MRPTPKLTRDSTVIIIMTKGIAITVSVLLKLPYYNNLCLSDHEDSTISAMVDYSNK